MKTLRQRLVSGGSSSVTSDERPTISTSVVDRKDECRDVQGFLDSPTHSLLFVTGLDEVGKMTVIETAHAQSGRSDTVIIRLTPESSLEFLLNSVARSVGLPADVSITDLAFAKDQTLVERIRSGMSVIIDNAQFLTDHGTWRDNRAGDFIRDLAEAVSSRNGRLILVSNRRLDVDGFSQSRIRRLTIGGLQADDAHIVLDQHLRRVGLRPEHFPQAERQSLAVGLGGHPGAIALAASYVEESGFATVSDDVRQRRGVHEKIVARILRQSQFSEEETLILALMCLARVPVPIDVFHNVVSFPAAPSVFSLIHQTIVDRGAYDRVSVNDLVRGYASLPDVDETTRTLFHKAAASQFTNLAKGGEAAQHLRWAVEADYHARLAGDSNLAPKVTQLIDGALGAIKVLIADHQYEKAKPLIDHLLASQRLPEVTELAALVHARLGLADDALTLAKETVALDSTRTWILSEVGRVALFVHRKDIAENAISLARKLGRDDSYLAVLEGQMHLRDHNSSAAAECFQRAMHLSEGERFHNTWPYFYYGRTLLKVDRVPDALEILFNGEKIEADKQRPNRKVLVALRTQLALANLYAGHHENAARLMALVYEEDRGNPEVVWAMAFLRGAQQSTDVATTALRELDPNKARDRYQRCQIHLYRALIWLGLGEKDHASRELSFAHAADPRNVFVLLRWADTLLRMARESQSEGEPEAAFYCAEQAKTLCNKVLEFNAGNAEALAMLERISDEFGLR